VVADDGGGADLDATDAAERNGSVVGSRLVEEAAAVHDGVHGVCAVRASLAADVVDLLADIRDHLRFEAAGGDVVRLVEKGVLVGGLGGDFVHDELLHVGRDAEGDDADSLVLDRWNLAHNGKVVRASRRLPVDDCDDDLAPLGEAVLQEEVLREEEPLKDVGAAVGRSDAGARPAVDSRGQQGSI
jgi:hypothetical protein